MKIIIAGAGDVGSHLAKLLSNEEQDILVIDQNSAKIDIGCQLQSYDNGRQPHNLQDPARSGRWYV